MELKNIKTFIEDKQTIIIFMEIRNLIEDEFKNKNNLNKLVDFNTSKVKDYYYILL
jgi:hypothetical protein